MKQVTFIYRVMPLTILIFLILFIEQVGFHVQIFVAWALFTIFSLSFAKRLSFGGRIIGRFGVIISALLSLVTVFFAFKIWQLIADDQVQSRMLLPAQEGIIVLVLMAIAYAFSAIKLIYHSRS